MATINEIMYNPWTGITVAFVAFAIVIYLHATRTKK
jgi:hypothetical protein